MTAPGRPRARPPKALPPSALRSGPFLPPPLQSRGPRRPAGPPPARPPPWRPASGSRARRLCPSGGAALPRGRFRLTRTHNLRTKPRRAGAFPALSALASAPFQCISVNAASPAAAGSSADAAERGLAWPIGAAARAASQSELWVPPRKLFHPPPPRAAPPAPGVPRFSRPPLLTPHPGSLAQGPPEWEAISWARCSRRPHGRQLTQMLSGGLPARHIWPAPGRPRRQSLLWCIVAAPGQTSAVV